MMSLVDKTTEIERKTQQPAALTYLHPSHITHKLGFLNL